MQHAYHKAPLCINYYPNVQQLKSLCIRKARSALFVRNEIWYAAIASFIKHCPNAQWKKRLRHINSFTEHWHQKCSPCAWNSDKIMALTAHPETPLYRIR